MNLVFVNPTCREEKHSQTLISQFLPSYHPDLGEVRMKEPSPVKEAIKEVKHSMQENVLQPGIVHELSQASKSLVCKSLVFGIVHKT